MLNKTNAFRVVLVALLLAALACNAVTNALGGDSRVPDAQATLDAASTEAAEQLENFATPEDQEPVEEEPTAETNTDPTATGGPEDIPVLEGENENFFASPEVVTYFSPATYDELVTFYKEQMPANGWELDATLSTEFGGVAVLTFKKDNRTASVTISPDPSSGKTVIAIGIVQQ